MRPSTSTENAYPALNLHSASGTWWHRSRPDCPHKRSWRALRSRECKFNYGKGIVRNFKAKDEGKAFFYDGYAYVITTDPTLCAGGVTFRLKCIDSELESLTKATIHPLDKNTVDNDRTLKYVAEHLAAARMELKKMKEHGFISSSIGEDDGSLKQ